MSDYFSGDHNPLKTDASTEPKPKPRRKVKDDLGLGFWGSWPIQIITIACFAVFAAQVFQIISLFDYAFSPAAMEAGRYWTMFTCIFLHGSLIHIGFNLWAYMSIAPMVFRRFGKGIAAFVPFFLFYVLTGLAGNAVFWVLHPGSEVPVVGASGAIFGLWGGMIRLNPFSDRLDGLFSRNVLRGWGYFIVSNLIVVLAIGGPLLFMQYLGGVPPEQLFIPIAWEAHLGGFVAGLLLIGFFIPKGWDETWKVAILRRAETMAQEMNA